MSTLDSRECDFKGCLRPLLRCFHQEHWRSDKLKIGSKEHDALKEEMKCLKDKLCVLEGNAKSHETEITELQAEKEAIRSKAETLTAKLEDAESQKEHWNKKAEELQGKVNGLDTVGKKQASQIKVLMPLAWAGCFVRLGRLHNVVKYSGKPDSKHKASNNIIAARNRMAHDADVAADVALLEFVRNCKDGRGELRGIELKNDQLHEFLEEEFGLSLLEIKKLMANKAAKNLLTVRGTIWGKRNMIASCKRSHLADIDQLLQEYKHRVTTGSSLDPFSEAGALAAQLEGVMSRAQAQLR